MVASVLPRFDSGSVAFYKLAEKILAVNVLRSRLSPGKGREYRVSRNGLYFWLPEAQLLTGWESDFPGFDSVEWGDVRKDEHVPSAPDKEELEAEEQLALQWDFTEQWEPDEDYYSNLADRYESA